jgi:uncharacterized protein with von Willebrand factor type A (vWA) domain
MSLDPALARTPAGETVDGRRLLAQSVRFGRALRAEGLGADLSAAIDFARALTLVDVADRELVRAAGATMFVRRRDEREIYDRAFDRFWRLRGWRAPAEMGPHIRPEEGLPGEAEGGEADAGDNRMTASEDVLGTALATPDDELAEEEGEIEGIIVAPDAFSATELLRHRDLERMTPAELREAERLVDLLEPNLERRRTRRYELHRHGRLLAPRTMFRRNLATGGQMTEWIWRRHVRRPRPLVVLCDISGSMERHSRLLLRFIQALSASSAVKSESFVFGTRLTRVTRLLKDRDRDRALSKVAAAVNDWAGGTRIGESFREFNIRWARRTLRSSGIVIVVSDGWDRGDPALVATETARLRRNCHRLIWLNPLAGTPGYQPLAAGMKAAYPFIDDFLPAGTIANLERLGEILAGVRASENRLSGEAAASVTSAGIRTITIPESIDASVGDRSAARPLTN